MPKLNDKNQRLSLQPIAASVVQVYKAGGFLLTFTFVGVLMMLAGMKFSHGLMVGGAVLTFLCLGFFAWGQIYSQVAKDRQTPGLRKFLARVEDCWWERIEVDGGSALSIFWIEFESLSNSVRLHGQTYDKDGKPTAYWNTAMARLLPADMKIEYLWQGKHQRLDPNVAFHGFGEIFFTSGTDSNDRIVRGTGRFWSVDESKKKAILKPIQVRRINLLRSIASQLRTEIFGHQPQHVRPCGLRGQSGGKSADDDTCRQETG